MKTYSKIALALILALFILPQAADAKWWIFGRSEAEVGSDYLYVNGIAFEERDTKITLYRDTLPNGMINIRGKALAKGNKVGTVQISIDGKENWEKAKLGDNGVFDFSFTPDTASTFNVYVKIIDTTGKSNDVDSTHKEIVISDQNMQAAVKEALDAMVAAYMQEDPRTFMSFVSPDFAGDDTVLDRAIRKDFSLFDNIDLRFTISGIASGAGGKIYVSIFYNRLVISSRNGNTFTDKGTTEFVFTFGDKGPKVFSMKQPLIFGLSDSENVATGTVVSATNNEVLKVDDNGGISIGPVNSDSGGGGSSIPAPTNLSVVAGLVHHFVDLQFETTLTDMELQGHEVVVEEATSGSGPWDEVERKPGDTFVRVEYPAGDPRDGTLYYRVRLVKNGSQSDPSNVVVFQNHW